MVELWSALDHNHKLRTLCLDLCLAAVMLYSRVLSCCRSAQRCIFSFCRAGTRSLRVDCWARFRIEKFKKYTK